MHNIERTQEYALSDTYVSSAGYNEILYVTPVVATRTRTVRYCRALWLFPPSREESATTTTSEDMIISSFFQFVVSLSMVLLQNDSPQCQVCVGVLSLRRSV